MSRIVRTLNAQSRIAMSFIGRTIARLKHLQRISKQREDAVEFVEQDTFVAIYLDGVLILKAIRNKMTEWCIEITEKLENLLKAFEKPAAEAA